MSNKVQPMEEREFPVSELHRKLVAIFADILQVDLDPNKEDIVLQEIPTWDSVNHLHLVLELEQAFDVNFDDEEAPRLTSLKAAKALLGKHGVTQ